MAGIDLSEMSLTDLKKLQKDVAAAIVDYTDRKRADAVAAAEAAAKELGYSLQELLGDAKAKGKRASSAAKYRHPDDAAITWSGRGRKPGWIRQIEESGRSLVDYLVGK